MQRTSLLCLFTLSTLACATAMSALHTQSWPKPHTRLVAAVKDIDLENDKPLIVEEVKIEPRNYKIASSFRRSRAIWGVYDKTSDRLETLEKSDQKPRIIKTKLGELILKKGQVVLVSPLSDQGSTHIEVARLPYAKKGNSYIIDFERASDEQKAALARLYGPLLNDVESYQKAEVQEMNCQRQKALLACELTLMVQ